MVSRMRAWKSPFPGLPLEGLGELVFCGPLVDDTSGAGDPPGFGVADLIVKVFNFFQAGND